MLYHDEYQHERVTLKKYHFKFKKYSADEKGNIYGIRKKIIAQMKHPTTGYGVVTLREAGEQKQYRAHRFIYECFIGRKIKKGYVINHKDGNKLNNSISNLEEITPKENTQHAFLTGLCTPKIGELNGNSIITAETVRNIVRDIMNFDMSNIELGKKYNLNPKHISLIRYKSRWKFIFEENEFKDYVPPKSRLTTGKHMEKLLKIIYFSKTTSLSNAYISRLFNVDQSAISRIRNGHNIWKDALTQYTQESSETIESLMTPSELVEYNQAVGSGITHD